jgi:hypothetical protein
MYISSPVVCEQSACLVSALRQRENIDKTRKKIIHTVAVNRSIGIAQMPAKEPTMAPKQGIPLLEVPADT